jgi:hypothetical protein
MEMSGQFHAPAALHPVKDPLEEMCNSYFSPNHFRDIKIRRMKWIGRVMRMRKMLSAYKISARKFRCRWEVNIKMDFK